MKKVTTFIIGLLTSFLLLINVAHADDIDPEICRSWLNSTVEIVESSNHADFLPTWLTKIVKKDCTSVPNNLNDTSRIWALKAAQSAVKQGFSCHAYQLIFQNSEPYWVIIVKQGDKEFVCDYHKVIHELYEKKLPLPSEPWPLMTFSDYMKVKIMDENKSLNLIYCPNDELYEPL